MLCLRAIAVCTMLVIVATLWTSLCCAEDWHTEKLRALLSASETKGNGDAEWSTSWTFDGKWLKPMGSKSLGFSVDSDYSKSSNAKLDRLRTAFRVLEGDYGKVRRQWYPVYMVQTEGDHSLDSIHTLVAAGARQKRRYGFFELTFGASREIKASDQWVGDVGFEFGYERKISNRWTFSSGPKGEYGALGSMRLRDDRLRYSWDVGIDYQANERLGFGYRLWYGNTVPNSDRTQWLGVTYKMK